MSEEGISKLEDRVTEIIWSEELKERRMKKMNRTSEKYRPLLSVTMGIPEVEERERGRGNTQRSHG